MRQLHMSKTTLKCLLAYAIEHPDQSVKPLNTGIGIKITKVMDSTLWDMRKRLLRNPILNVKLLKPPLSALENSSSGPSRVFAWQTRR